MATLPPIDESFESLGQVRPAANTLTDCLTVDSNEQNIVSSVIIANLSNQVDYYSISHAINGAADDPMQYLAEMILLNPRDSFTLTLGITLTGDDVIRVKSQNGNIAFNFYGVRLIPL